MDLRRMKVGFGTGSGHIFELLTQAGESVAAVARLVERRFLEWPAGPSQDEVKELEHVADRCVSELLVQTNALFVTPYDRDDLIELAFAVDDVADAAENASELLGLYGVESPTKQSFELCAILTRGATELADLLAGIRDQGTSQKRIVAIKELEDDGDRVARAARASLFKDDRIDPVIVIRWKDIYEALEDAIDACETAAHRVGNILVKNA
jgi:predicted phosphate transport protein (TIGR00153 family)